MTSTTAERAAALAGLLARMGGPTRDRFYPERPSDPDEHAARTYLEPDQLREHAYSTIPAADRQRVDPRAVVSRFTRAYCMAVVRPVLTALAIGIPLDASIERCAIVWRPWTVRGASAINPFGLWIDLEASAIPAEGRSPDAVRSDVHTALFAGHLARVFATVLRIAKISPKVLWGNAGEGVGGLATAAAESLDPAVAQPLLDVCDRVLTAKTLPGIDGPNPLLDHIGWEDVGRADFPHGLMVRRVCCISFTLPDRVPQIWCGACPLPTTEQRIALVRS